MRKRVLAGCAFVIAAVLGPLTTAESFQVKNVQSIHVSLSEEETHQSVSLPESVDWDRTLLWNFQSSPPLEASTKDKMKTTIGGEGDGFAAVFPDSSSSVQFRRGLSFKPVHSRLEAVFYAAEFKEGVRIQRGITRFDPEVYAKNISLLTLDPARSVPVLMTISSDPQTNQTEAFMFRASLKDHGTLRIERGSLPVQGHEFAPAFADVYWQVIEFDAGVNVSTGEFQMTNDKDSETAILKTPLENIDNAALFFNYSAEGKSRGDESLIFLRGYIEEKDVLRFSRARPGDQGAGAKLNVKWYLLDFTDGTSTQRGAAEFGEGETVRDVKIRPVAPCTALPVVSAASAPAGANPPENSSETTSDHLIKAELLGPDLLRLSRDGTQGVERTKVQAEWQVIEFSPFHMRTPLPGEVLRVGEAYDFIWSYADCVSSGGGVPGAEKADFSLVYPAEESPVTVPLVSGRLLRDQAFRMVMPAELSRQTTAGYPVRVKMSDGRKNPKEDFNPGSFAIKGNLRILEPAGGTIWKRDDKVNRIRWKVDGVRGDVAIFYDTDGGKDEHAFSRENYIAKVSAGSEPVVSYFWETMPDLLSKKVRLKVMQVSDPTVYSVSSADFTVYPKITFTEPKPGAADWQAHSTRHVAWRTNGRIDGFHFFFRARGSGEWKKIESVIQGGAAGEYGFDWEIPGEASGPDIELRVASTADAGLFEDYPEKGRLFSIGPWIRLERLPEAGTHFHALDQLQVHWTFGGSISLVLIEYSIDGGLSWTKQALADAAGGVYTWHFLDLQAKRVLIRVSDLNYSDVRDQSTVPFAVDKSQYAVPAPARTGESG